MRCGVVLGGVVLALLVMVCQVFGVDNNRKTCEESDCLSTKFIPSTKVAQERDGMGYVRRRCLGHLSWRVCDAGSFSGIHLESNRTGKVR